MPKGKWGSTLTAAEIDSAPANTGVYKGPLPPPGVYRFNLVSIKQGESNSGNPKALVFLRLDGSWKPAHKEFDGCPIWDHLPITKETNWRVRALVDAIGVSSKDFMNNFKTDSEGVILSIGNVKIQEGKLKVFVNCSVEEQDGYDPRLRGRGAGYLPRDDQEDPSEDEDNEDDEDDDSDEETPF